MPAVRGIIASKPMNFSSTLKPSSAKQQYPHIFPTWMLQLILLLTAADGEGPAMHSRVCWN
jgi:hypothetical protein